MHLSYALNKPPIFAPSTDTHISLQVVMQIFCSFQLEWSKLLDGLQAVAHNCAIANRDHVTAHRVQREAKAQETPVNVKEELQQRLSVLETMESWLRESRPRTEQEAAL